ncbi:MAG: transposase [Patescibacteria group bacterium]|nr:transposase [Patescibacteria group bacterium]MDE1944326.1 transposase [Patescibacteria group bacterium]MDE1944670.1 transposase [Patescibacteria group bacterium]MDE2057356.1 transposase [Patescibacteria group bacterium]
MELWHVIYRGVDGRDIFKDDQDRARFVHDLYEFNDTAPAGVYVGHTMSKARETIVEVHGWKLMPNHVHLLLSESRDDGFSLFLKKMRGYARYYNERHSRRGILFDKMKKVHIEREAHFLYILHYIHLNGLDDLPGAERWRERDKGAISDVGAALAHLGQDKWSSFRDYCGIANFPSILTTRLFEDRPREYERDLEDFLQNRTDPGLAAYDLE